MNGIFSPCVLALALASASAANAASILVNGDFEAGQTGFASDFFFPPASPKLNDAGWAAITTDACAENTFVGCSYGDHTSGSGNMLAVNFGTDPTLDLTVWRQTVSVEQNASYEFGLWISVWNGGGRLRFEVDGTPIGDNFANPVGTIGAWGQITRTWDSGSATSATLSVVQPKEEATFFAGDLAIDDLTFVKIAGGTPVGGGGGNGAGDGGGEVIGGGGVPGDVGVIPLPAGVWLMLTGIGGIAWLSRLRRRTA